MAAWGVLLSIGGGLAGVLVFLGLVADEVCAIESHLAYRRRIEADAAARRQALEAETPG